MLSPNTALILFYLLLNNKKEYFNFSNILISGLSLLIENVLIVTLQLFKESEYFFHQCLVGVVNHLNTLSVHERPIIKMFLSVPVKLYFLKCGPFVSCLLFLADNWRQIKTLSRLRWKVLTAKMKVCEFQSTTTSLVTKRGQSTCGD